MENFSKINIQMDRFADDVKNSLDFSPGSPWADSDMSDIACLKRIARSDDFWKFDHIYFPPDLYNDGYAPEGAFQRAIVNIAQLPGVHIIAAARKHGKTATIKKYLAWLILKKELKLSGVMSATLPQSRNILADIDDILNMPKIQYDFDGEFVESNADQLTLKSKVSRTSSRVMTFSEGRSVRGTTKLFDRIEFILIDDLETRQSAINEEQTNARIKLVVEAYQSLSQDGTIIVLANNFDERCATNKLKKMADNNLLYPNWHYYEFPAWSDKQKNVAGVRIKKGSLWYEKYPAGSVDELKYLLGVADESNWLGEYQQSPAPPEGEFFKRDYFQTYKPGDLPADARGIVFCDPNLAKKGKGDTTAIVALLYSSKTDLYYVADAVCKSFDNSNELLDAVMNIRFGGLNLSAVAFDGNVTQESTWSNNIKNWSRINSVPYSSVEYKRYRVDDLAKNCQMAYSQKRILFNSAFSDSPEGERFKRQLFSFTSKKSNKTDDAPDALISAFEFITERGLARHSKIALNLPLLTTL